MRDTYAIYARKYFTPHVPKFFIGRGDIVILIRHNVYYANIDYVDNQQLMKV